MKALGLFVLFVFMGVQLVGLQAKASTTRRPPQFVLLAFDGSKSHTMWEETLRFAAENRVKFTYFISAVYFLANRDKNQYIEPQRGRGKSAINFGGSPADISKRLEYLMWAHNSGHEIASHANGHYDGSSYTEHQWNFEFRQFDGLLQQSWSYYKAEQPANWGEVLSGVMGFRAPQLGKGKGLWRALPKNGYVYDTSRIDKMNYWPVQIKGVWNFPLAGLRIAGTGRKTLSMDYNFYYAQTKAKKGDPGQFSTYENQMFETYMSYFENNYYGNRAPVDIGHHFSRWNGGAYWKALKRFAQSVCRKPEVRCVTYRELTQFLQTRSPQELLAYQKGQFPRYVESQVIGAQGQVLGQGGLSQEAASLPEWLFGEAGEPTVNELSDAELEELRATTVRCDKVMH